MTEPEEKYPLRALKIPLAKSAAELAGGLVMFSESLPSPYLQIAYWALGGLLGAGGFARGVTTLGRLEAPQPPSAPPLPLELSPVAEL